MRRLRNSAGDASGQATTKQVRGVVERLPPGGVLTGYLAIAGEVDVEPALQAWIARGGCTGLPCTGPPRSPLVFRAWAPGDPLVSERFGTRCPPETAPEVEPTVLLVPLLAFDREGNRLGWGGGFYDRTLARLRDTRRVLALGVAFAAQEMDAVPAGPLDQPLDGVITGAGLVTFSRSPWDGRAEGWTAPGSA